MIELLCVIGIIVVLVAMVAFGINKVLDSGRRSTTKVTLENLRSMLSEFETTTKGLSRQSYMYRNGARIPASAGGPIPPGMDIWRDGDPTDGVASAANPEGDPENSPGDVQKGSGDAGRYNSDAILNTQAVIGLMKGAPAVATTLNQLPTSQLMEKVPTGTTTNLTRDANNVAVPPVVLDGWGNPIIFVPASGLYNVHFSSDQNGAAPHLITSSKMRVPNGNNDRANVRVDRPFFASAGPDGVFGYVDTNLNGSYETATDKPGGDDNIYSFEQ